MAFFPTDRSIYDAEQYSAQEMDTDLGMNTLMKMDEKGRSTGIYKISLFGGGILEARYPIENILCDPPSCLQGHFSGTSFKARARADQSRQGNPCLPAPVGTSHQEGQDPARYLHIHR
jgi:hypothetical protein